MPLLAEFESTSQPSGSAGRLTKLRLQTPAPEPGSGAGKDAFHRVPFVPGEVRDTVARVLSKFRGARRVNKSGGSPRTSLAGSQGAQVGTGEMHLWQRLQEKRPCHSRPGALGYSRECNEGQQSPALPALTSDLRRSRHQPRQRHRSPAFRPRCRPVHRTRPTPPKYQPSTLSPVNQPVASITL